MKKSMLRSGACWKTPSCGKPTNPRFFREYFEYGGAIDIFKDEALNRNHVPEVLVSDTDRLILHFYEQDKNVLRELLTTNRASSSMALTRKQKNQPVPRQKTLAPTSPTACPPIGNGFLTNPVPLPRSQRSGILTQPAWLVAKSGNFDNHAIHRGIWVRSKLLGGIIPDLPITVDAQLPNDDTHTLREKMKVTEQAYCWKCHQNTNPVGLPFRDVRPFWTLAQELGKPVDTRGAITNSGALGRAQRRRVQCSGHDAQAGRLAPRPPSLRPPRLPLLHGP